MSRDIKDFVQGLGVGASIGNMIVRGRRADRAEERRNPRNAELEDFDARHGIGENWGGARGWIRRRKQDIGLGGRSAGGMGAVDLSGVSQPQVTVDPSEMGGGMTNLDDNGVLAYAGGGAVEYSEPNAVEGEWAGETGDMTPMPTNPTQRLAALRRRAATRGQSTPMPDDRVEAIPLSEVVEDDTQTYVPRGAMSVATEGPLARPSTRLAAIAARTPQGQSTGMSEPEPGAGPMAVTMATPPSESNFGSMPPQDSEPGAPGAKGAKPGVTPSGKGAVAARGRKRLRDQTRTEAFDEVADKDDPDNVLKNALHGGLMFAQHVFHLDQPQGQAVGPDPQSAAGMKELMRGTGAATPEEVATLDTAVQRMYPKDDFQGPDGQARLMLRRMEIIYRHASNNGLTDKANKMAFEILQYAAGEASKLAQMGVAAYKGGDIEAAKQYTAAAYNKVPDGYFYAPSTDGKSVVVSSVASGKLVQTIPYTPEMLFNAAMSMSNRGGYWQHLVQRASMVASKGKQQDPLKDELTRARIDLTRARTAKLGQGKGGGGGAVVSGDGVAAALDKIDQMRVPRAGRESTTPPQGSTDGAPADDERPAPVDPAMQDALSGSDGDGEIEQGDQSGKKPALAAPTPNLMPAQAANPRPAAEQIASPPPEALNQPPVRPGAPAKFDPEGDGYDMETAKAAGLKPDKDGHWPSRDPRTGMMLKGAKHESFQTAVEDDDKLGYALVKGKDGRYYTQKAGGEPTGVNTPEKFDEPHPLEPFGGKNPYAQILADPKNAAYFATKQGRAQKTGITAKKQELDRDVADWKKAERDFKKANKDAAKAAAKAETDEAKAVYNKKFDAKQATDLSNDIFGEIDLRAKSTDEKDKRPSIFNDGTDPNVVHDLAMDLVTTNPNLPPKRGVALLASLARAGTTEQDREERAFKPLGKSKAGTVVVEMDGRQIHMRPEAYVALNKLVHDRWTRNVSKGKKDSKSGAVLGITGDDVGEFGTAIKDYFTSAPGSGKSVYDSAGRAAVNTGEFFMQPAENYVEPVRRAIPGMDTVKEGLRRWSNTVLPRPFKEKAQ